MTQVPLQLLIVESDHEMAARLAVTAASRECATVGVASATEAYGALERRTFDVAVIDLSPNANEGFDLLQTINERYPSTVTVVTSAAASVDLTVRSYEMAAFRFVPKPYDAERLLDTVREAVDHGWKADRHHRLFWELQIINEIADGITHSLELTDVLTGALQRLRGALGLAGGAIRLRDELTGEYGVAAVVGAAAMQRIWTRQGGEIERPSDRVLATRRAVVIEDLAPMLQGDDAHTVAGAERRERPDVRRRRAAGDADGHRPGTPSFQPRGPAAVDHDRRPDRRGGPERAPARLHPARKTRLGENLRRDRRSDRGVRRPWGSAPRQYRAGSTPPRAGHRVGRPDVPRRRLLRRRMPGVRRGACRP